MINKIKLILFASYLLTACRSIATAVPVQPITSSVPTITLTPSPSSTATSIQLSDIFLEDILLNPGDLPSDFIGQQIRSTLPEKLSNLPKPDQFIQQEFRYGEYASDGIMIILYNDPTDLSKGYEQLLNKIWPKKDFTELNDLGEKSVIRDERDSLFGVTSVQTVFLRCHALVYIDLFSPSADIDMIKTYALRVDDRLKPLACQ